MDKRVKAATCAARHKSFRIVCMKILSIFLLLFLVSCTDSSVGVEDINPLEDYLNLQINSVSKLRTTYLDQLDEYRHSYGVDVLIYSEEIEKVAQEHAQRMASGVVSFSHLGSGTRCEKIISHFVTGNLCGEIIAKGYNSAQTVFESWRKSLPHEAHLKNSRYTHTGLGIAESLDGVLFWTQIFLEVE